VEGPRNRTLVIPTKRNVRATQTTKKTEATIHGESLNRIAILLFSEGGETRQREKKKGIHGGEGSDCS